jgi:Coiled stalk of trimeric autotransporter adhesin
MPFNTGVFTRLYSWVNDAASSIPITATRMDNDSNDIASALSNCVTRDGQGYFATNVNFNGYKGNNVAAGTLRTDAVNVGQLQDSLQDYLTSIAGTNTITANLSGLTAYVAGQSFWFLPAATNTGAVTINIQGLGAKNITKGGAIPLVAGDIVAGAQYRIYYDGTQFQLNSFANYASVAGASGNLAGVVGLAASATLTLAQLGSQIVFYGSTASQTLSLPAASTVAAGKGYWFTNVSAVSVSITANGTDTIGTNVPGIGLSQPATLVLQPGDTTFLISNGTGVWYEQQGVRAVNGPTVRASALVTYTTNTSLSSSDIGRVSAYYNVSTGGTFTLPPTSSLYVGACITCTVTAAGLLGISANTGQSIIGFGSAGVAGITLGFSDCITLQWNGTYWVQISGAAQFGVGQTPQIQTLGAGAGQRQAGTTYTNTFGKPIEVNITFTSVGSIGDWIISIGGTANKRGGFIYNPGGSTYSSSLIFTVPVGATYSVAAANITGSFTITQWTEQR